MHPQAAQGPEQWTTVGEAARTSGLPSRTLYRWLRSGTLRSKAEGKTMLVDMAEVQRLGAQRGTAPLSRGAVPASAGGLSAQQAGGMQAGQLDGRLASRLFARFENGSTPEDVVREEQLSPNVVLQAHHDWAHLRNLPGGRGEPRLPDVLKTLLKEIGTLRSEVDQLREEVCHQCRSFSDELTGHLVNTHRLREELRHVRELAEHMAPLLFGLYQLAFRKW